MGELGAGFGGVADAEGAAGRSVGCWVVVVVGDADD